MGRTYRNPSAVLIACSLILLGVSAASIPVSGVQNSAPRNWNEPVKPFRIIGNIYYVGASDLTSYLITTSQGHILIDGGLEQTVPLIQAGVTALGFKMTDIKILLGSHAHYDHAAGLADLKRITGAKMLATEQDAVLLSSGGRGDYLFGDKYPFKPVVVDRKLKDLDTVSIGDVTLTAHLTPGHTKGNTTWTMKVTDAGKTYDVVWVGSGTVLPGIRFVDKPSYPGIADDYARTFAVLKSLPCDVFLAPHASFFSMTRKLERIAQGEGGNPFIDPDGYKAYVAGAEQNYLKLLDQERKAQAAK